jgi:DNA-binding MarR family transcriptional regulator
MREPVLPRRLLDASRAIDGEIEEALRDRGVWELRSSQARNLLLVDRTGTRLSELAHRAGITKQRMMQVVDELQLKGFVRRTPDPEDARAKVVRLTAKGLRHRAEARRALLAVEARARRQLGGRRYDQLASMLEELSSAEE